MTETPADLVARLVRLLKKECAPRNIRFVLVYGLPLDDGTHKLQVAANTNDGAETAAACAAVVEGFLNFIEDRTEGHA